MCHGSRAPTCPPRPANIYHSACGSESDDAADGSAGGANAGGGASGGETSDASVASGGASGSGDCSTASCTHAEGTHAGLPFNLTCADGENGFAPNSVVSPVGPDAITYDALCTDGLNTDGYGTTYNVHLGLSADTAAALAPDTYTFNAATKIVDGVSLILQVTKSPAAQMSEGSPNFEEASLTITAHEPRVSVSGTFTGRWGANFTVDEHAPYVHTQLCFGWEGTGCDVAQADAVPADCVCTSPVPFVVGEVTGTFHWAF